MAVKKTSVVAAKTQPAQQQPNTQNMSILHPVHSKELQSFMRGLLKKISTELEIPLESLYDVACSSGNSCNDDKNKMLDDECELEYKEINNKKYLYDHDNNRLYSFDNKPVYLGSLNADGDIVLR